MKKKGEPDFKRVSALMLGSSLRSSSGKGVFRSGPIFARKDNHRKSKFAGVILFLALSIYVWDLAFGVSAKHAPEFVTKVMNRVRGIASEK